MEKSIGALWEKNGAKGKFMSGSIKVGDQEVRVVCFTNSRKSESKHPDWQIYVSHPRIEQPKENQVENLNTDEIDPNDTPF